MTSCKGILSHINETNGTLIILFELFIVCEQEDKTKTTAIAATKYPNSDILRTQRT